MCLTWFLRLAKGLQIFGHGGATHGQQADFHFIPEKDFALAMLTNSDDGGIINDNALRWALEVYFQAAFPKPKPVKRTRQQLKEYEGFYELPLSAFDLKARDGYLVLHEQPRGGFPTPDTPAGPPLPPVRFALYERDRIIGLDEPFKEEQEDFFRDQKGKLIHLRLSGRLHRKIS